MNLTIAGEYPPVVQHAYRSKPPLYPGVSDYTLSLIVPIAVHWFTAGIYEIIQYFELLQKYRIHTSEEERARNRPSRLECLRGVILVQILQTLFGIVLGQFSGAEERGDEDRDIMVWENRLHDSGRRVYTLLAFSGINYNALVTKISGLFFERSYFTSGHTGYEVEHLMAKLICYGLLPVIRFYAALWLADTWVFFIHRAEHRNQWLYRNFHSRHHDLKVPYSWGGIYDHPVESLFLSVGAYIFAVIGSGMTLRESMLFSAFSSAKACTDHGGYQFPWIPLDLFTTVGAVYHDKHHQHWGFKNNFALHFRFWDRLLGSEFVDADAAIRLYSRDRKAVETATESKRKWKEASSHKKLI